MRLMKQSRDYSIHRIPLKVPDKLQMKVKNIQLASCNSIANYMEKHFCKSTHNSSMKILQRHNQAHQQPLHIVFFCNGNRSSFQIEGQMLNHHRQHKYNNEQKFGFSWSPTTSAFKCFSTTSSPPNNGNDSNKRNDESDQKKEETQILKKQHVDHTKNPVDKEFVDYLTGKLGEDTSPFIQQSHSMDFDGLSTVSEKSKSKSNESGRNSEDDMNSTSSSSMPLEYFKIPQTELDQTNTKELYETYKKIELTQSINIEKSRKKRLITVRRALGGNVIIALSKLAAFLHSGSSAMMSEFVHSVVDCGNQSLLLLGLRDSGNVADRSHNYGYGKSIYFWALVSALGTFFLGAGVSMTQALPNLIYGSNLNLHEITWHVWGVLGFSFVVDGYVFTRTLIEVRDTMPKNVTLWKHITTLRDPATLAILLEDGAACIGVVMAIGGLGLTQALDMPVYDALAGVGISGLLASMGLILVRVNHSFLLGQSVDAEISQGIEKILLNRKSIDAVHSVQSQWTGAETFSFKAEVDFDGTFLAAKLMPRYQQEFAEAKATLDQDLRVLLSWYAEDVMRTVEREVRNIEAEIRKEYPGAQYIELEPMSKDADRFAIDDGLEASLKRIEIESLNRYLKSLYASDLSILKANSQSLEDNARHKGGDSTNNDQKK